MSDKQEVKISGVSHAFYFAILWILAMAAIAWLSFYMSLHYFRRELAQERRRAEAVGADPLPQEKINIKIVNPRDGSIRVTKVEIDGGDVFVYYKNVTQQRVEWIKFAWKLMAPDGTVIKSYSSYAGLSFTGGSAELDPGQSAELKIKIDADPRGATFEIRMEGRSG